MTPEELIKSYDKTIRDMTGSPRGDIMLKVGVTANTMIKKRVIETGKDAEGQKFKAYSTKDMLIGKSSFPKKSVQDEVFGSKEKRATLKWVTLGGNKFSQYLEASSGGSGDIKRLAVLEGGYKKWRDLMGVGSDIVNFSVTNDMWNDIHVISNTGDHIKGVAIIGAKQEKEKKKLEGNTKRRGDILDLSKTEIDELMRLYNIGTLQIFKNNGL
jgi:hypothetical protein